LLGAATPRDRSGTRRLLRRLVPGPRLLVALVVLALLAGGGWLWLRDSSLVGVRRVQIVGLTGPDAARIRTALRAAALNMSTLHVRLDALRSAVEPFPVVKSIRAYAHPPHALRIEVVEQVPVARADFGGRSVPIAPDGTVLPASLGTAGLPALPGSGNPGAGRLTSPSVLRAVALLAAAPPDLRARVGRVTFSRAHGLVVLLRHRAALYFGGAVRLAAKWAAAAAVLADRDSSGARYIDLRIPERPAAGGLVPAAVATAPTPGASPVPLLPTVPATPAAGPPTAPPAGAP
jgi:cell division protein FtsQ